MDLVEEDILMHYGVKRRSGRYPWGSGDNPYQHGGDFLARVEELQRLGKTEKQIADELHLSTTDLRMQVRVAKHERRALQADRARSLREDGKTLDEIASILGYTYHYEDKDWDLFHCKEVATAPEWDGHKEQLHAVHYARYMDDMVIFGSNKKVLHQIRLAISEYMASELGLSLKGDWQVFRFSYTVNGEDKGRPLDFMGFQFYRNRTVLRKSIMLKATRKARKIHKKPYQGRKPTVHDYRQMMSYLGWIDCTDTYGMYLKHIKPMINFQKMKRYVSHCDMRNDRRIYEQLVRLYLPRGGKRSGTYLHPR